MGTYKCVGVSGDTNPPSLLLQGGGLGFGFCLTAKKSFAE